MCCTIDSEHYAMKGETDSVKIINGNPYKYNVCLEKGLAQLFVYRGIDG